MILYLINAKRKFAPVLVSGRWRFYRLKGMKFQIFNLSFWTCEIAHMHQLEFMTFVAPLNNLPCPWNSPIFQISKL